MLCNESLCVLLLTSCWRIGRPVVAQFWFDLQWDTQNDRVGVAKGVAYSQLREGDWVLRDSQLATRNSRNVGDQSQSRGVGRKKRRR